MTMFASKSPRDLSTDPEPWLVWLEPTRPNGKHRTWRGAADDWDDAIERAEAANRGWHAYSAGRVPRPEYDCQQRNPHNPILDDFRRADIVEPLFIRAFIGGAENAAQPGDAAEVTERIDHARRVLERLARLRDLATGESR